MKKKIAAGVAVMTALGAAAVSPYIARVHDYCPAPGQFINELPIVEDGMGRAEVLAEVEANIAGAATGEARPGMISLGAFGGYVTFSFDHPVVNVAGQPDFKIYGNAMLAAGHSDGGSAEPGIVMVSVDANGNGEADDEWFELAGSEFDPTADYRRCTITYYRPGADHKPTPDAADRSIIDKEYIRWTTDDPAVAEGYVQRNVQHPVNDYWPSWIEGETLTFTGSRLESTARLDGGQYILPFFAWGYADNRPNDDDEGFDISRAVDSNGKTVALDKIDFIRVHTAQIQTCGILGETSTEIAGGEDLHPDAVAGIASVGADSGFAVLGVGSQQVTVSSDRAVAVEVYSLEGRLVARQMIGEGRSTVDLGSLGRGVYVLSAGDASARIAL